MTAARREQRRLLGLRRAVHYAWTHDREDSMGGKPSKGTVKDKRLAENKGAKKK
jgi:hypothetical protein